MRCILRGSGEPQLTCCVIPLRGNIYAQHDEPLNAADAEYFDPGWMGAVELACSHTNRTIRLTAIAILKAIKSYPDMRHRHSRVALIEARLSAPQTPQALVQSAQQKSTGSETGRLRTFFYTECKKDVRKGRCKIIMAGHGTGAAEQRRPGYAGKTTLCIA